MPRLYAEADLLVQSSLTEGLPNVILEAAYLRLPLVATRVGGTAEVVEHPRSGWLVRPGRVEDLTAGIARFLAHPQEFIDRAEAAHRDVREKFSFAARTRRLTEFYEAMFAQRQS